MDLNQRNRTIGALLRYGYLQNGRSGRDLVFMDAIGNSATVDENGRATFDGTRGVVPCLGMRDGMICLYAVGHDGPHGWETEPA